MIELLGIGKKFERQLLFKDINFCFEASKKYAITGTNGSGKSTLLKIISGMQSPSKGFIKWTKNGLNLEVSDVYKFLSFTSPSLDLAGELTVEETLSYHSKFREMYYPVQEILKLIEIPGSKQIQYLSSGMKQRLKLALAIFTKSDLVLLDEPTANFDNHWKDTYQKWLANYQFNRTIIIASNEENEYKNADSVISID